MKLYIKEFVKPDYEIIPFADDKYASPNAPIRKRYVIKHIKSHHFISKMGKRLIRSDFSTYWRLEDAISYCQSKNYYFTIRK